MIFLHVWQLHAMTDLQSWIKWMIHTGDRQWMINFTFGSIMLRFKQWQQYVMIHCVLIHPEDYLCRELVHTDTRKGINRLLDFSRICQFAERTIRGCANSRTSGTIQLSRQVPAISEHNRTGLQAKTALQAHWCTHFQRGPTHCSCAGTTAWTGWLSTHHTRWRRIERLVQCWHW